MLYLDVLILLLNAGGNVNIRDGEGSTPLHRAASGAHVNCVEELLDRYCCKNLI